MDHLPHRTVAENPSPPVLRNPPPGPDVACFEGPVLDFEYGWIPPPLPPDVARFEGPEPLCFLSPPSPDAPRFEPLRYPTPPPFDSSSVSTDPADEVNAAKAGEEPDEESDAFPVPRSSLLGMRYLIPAIEACDIACIPEQIQNARERFPDGLDFKHALRLGVCTGNADVVRVLLEHGLPLDDFDMLQAIANKDYKAVLRQIVLSLSPPIDKMWCGYTMLSIVVPFEDLVASYLSKGADVNELYHRERGDENTALCRAIEIGPDSVIRMLLDAGADVTLGAPLIRAVERIHQGKATLALMEELIARGVDVNKHDGYVAELFGQRGTALLRACYKRVLPVVRLLLAHGANPFLSYMENGKQVPGCSAIDMAIRRDDRELVSILQGHINARNGLPKAHL